MLANLTATGLGVLMLVLFGVFYVLGIFATIRAVLAFVGTCLIGTVGFLGGALHAVALWVSNLAASLTGWAFAAPVGGLVLVVIAGVIFIHDLMPKHTAGKRTGWAGIALAALLIAGVSGIPQLNNIPAGVQNGVTNARTVVNGG
jgi:hypothetical protein